MGVRSLTFWEGFRAGQRLDWANPATPGARSGGIRTPQMMVTLSIWWEARALALLGERSDPAIHRKRQTRLPPPAAPAKHVAARPARARSNRVAPAERSRQSQGRGRTTHAAPRDRPPQRARSEELALARHFLTTIELELFD